MMILGSELRRCVSCTSLVIVGTVFAAQASAQSYSRNVYVGPGTALSAQIHAEADYIRGEAEATLNYAHAREKWADARKKEIINAVDYVRAYYAGKAIYEAEKLKHYVAPLQRLRIGNSKTWERLKDHPELNGPAIINGRALNFLLNRLSGSVLAYKFTVGEDQIDPKFLKQVDLSPALVHQLVFMQDVGGNQRSVFRADEGTVLNVEWWPFIIRGDEFASFRKDFEKLRQRLGDEAKQNGKISTRSLKDLLSVLDALDAEVHRHYQLGLQKSREKASYFRDFNQYQMAKRFIQSLTGEVLNLQRTGDPQALNGGLKFGGKNLIDILTHMSRNGLQFAGAKPGEEAAYHTVFRMMRDLYLTVADDDTSLAH